MAGPAGLASLIDAKVIQKTAGAKHAVPIPAFTFEEDEARSTIQTATTSSSRAS